MGVPPELPPIWNTVPAFYFAIPPVWSARRRRTISPGSSLFDFVLEVGAVIARWPRLDPKTPKTTSSGTRCSTTGLRDLQAIDMELGIGMGKARTAPRTGAVAGDPGRTGALPPRRAVRDQAARVRQRSRNHQRTLDQAD